MMGAAVVISIKIAAFFSCWGSHNCFLLVWIKNRPGVHGGFLIYRTQACFYSFTRVT
jgi:hypothetical protein